MIYVEDILNIGLLIDPLRDIIMALESMERESHHRGGPRIEIERNQLENFVECGFSVAFVLKILLICTIAQNALLKDGCTSYQLDQAIFHKSQIQSWIIKFQIY